MHSELREVLSCFPTVGEIANCERYGKGHINETYLVVGTNSKRYILQKINEKAFNNIPALMENIAGVTEHISRISDDPRATMRLEKTANNENWLRHESGAWRLYDFVEGTICLQAAETPNDFYESAVAFGRFQNQLTDFPAETLTETIKNFHYTADRYRIFKEVLKNDSYNRAKNVQNEIDFILDKEEEVTELYRLYKNGTLPLRVTHNDTKLNNVLLDNVTRKAVCVIDLDTVMPGLAAYDFGDSIRFGAATAAEDEKDLDKMTINLDLYEIFSKGFLGQCVGLNKEEILSLPLGAKTMTMECGVRFLTDYLDGDHYFAIDRENHNLDRARTQFKLVKEMDNNWDSMRKIIEKYI